MIVLLFLGLFCSLAFFSSVFDANINNRLYELNYHLKATTERRTTYSDPQKLLRLSKERMKILSSLVEKDPRRCESFLFEDDVAEKLRSDGAIVEKKLHLENAEFHLLGVTYPENHKVTSKDAYFRYIVHEDHGRITAHVYKEGELLQSFNGRISGWIIDSKFLVDPITYHEQMERGERRNIEVTGSMSLIYYLSDFSDKVRTNTVQNIVDLMDVINEWYDSNSYGQFNFNNIVVTPNYRLSQLTTAYTSYYVICDEMKALATADEPVLYDDSNYDYWICSFTRNTNVGDWAGRGGVGSARVWINGYDDFRVVSHELGHNVGLHHANALTQTTNDAVASFGGDQSINEYGDYFSDMGSRSFDHNHFNLYHKHRVGWVTETVEMLKYEGNLTISTGEYTIYAHDHPGGFGKLLGLRFKWHQENDQFWYVISHRSRTDNYHTSRTGALDLHMTYKFYNRTHLIDTNLYSCCGIYDAPIGGGASHVDEFSHPRFAITTLSRQCPKVSTTCPGEGCDYLNAEPCNIKFYLHTGPPNAAAPDPILEIFNLHMWSNSLTVNYPIVRNGYDLLFVDVNNKDISIPIEYNMRVQTSDTMVSMKGRSPWIDWRLNHDENRTCDIIVSDYINSRIVKRHERSDDYVTTFFTAGTIGVSKTLEDDDVGVFDVRTTSGSDAELFLYHNNIMLKKMSSSQEMHTLANNSCCGYNFYISRGFDGKFLRDSSKHEFYRNNIPFSISFRKLGNTITYNFSPPPLNRVLNRIVPFMPGHFKDSSIIYDRVQPDNTIIMTQNAIHRYLYPINLRYNTTLSFEILCGHIQVNFALSLQMSRHRHDVTKSFNLCGYKAGAIPGYELTGINDFTTVHIPVGKEFYDRRFPLNYMYLTFDRDQPGYVGSAVIIKDVRFYDVIDDVKADITSSSVGNSITYYNPNAFTYHWSSNHMDVFQSITGSQAVVMLNVADRYERIINTTTNTTQPVVLKLVVKAGDDTVLLRRTFNAEWMNAGMYYNLNGIPWWIWLTMSGLIVFLCVPMLLVLVAICIFAFICIATGGDPKELAKSAASASKMNEAIEEGLEAELEEEEEEEEEESVYYKKPKKKNKPLPKAKPSFGNQYNAVKKNNPPPRRIPSNNNNNSYGRRQQSFGNPMSRSFNAPPPRRTYSNNNNNSSYGRPPPMSSTMRSGPRKRPSLPKRAPPKRKPNAFRGRRGGRGGRGRGRPNLPRTKPPTLRGPPKNRFRY